LADRHINAFVDWIRSEVAADRAGLGK